jgi:hypothetical protein
VLAVERAPPSAPEDAAGVDCVQRHAGLLGCILFGRNADPHLAERRRVVALAPKPADQRPAEPVNGLQVAGALPSEHYWAGPCEFSGEDGHGHAARDFATADQVRGELCLLVRVGVGGVRDGFLDEERRKRRLDTPGGQTINWRLNTYARAVGTARPRWTSYMSIVALLPLS